MILASVHQPLVVSNMTTQISVFAQHMQIHHDIVGFIELPQLPRLVGSESLVHGSDDSVPVQEGKHVGFVIVAALRAGYVPAS